MRPSFLALVIALAACTPDGRDDAENAAEGAQAPMAGKIPVSLPDSYRAVASDGMRIRSAAAEQETRVTLYRGDGAFAGLTYVLAYEAAGDETGQRFFSSGNQIILRLASADLAARRRLANELGGSLEPLGIADLFLLTIDGPTVQSVEALLATAEARSDVVYAEPNWVQFAIRTPNDPHLRRQWYLNNVGQSGGTVDADVDAPEGWDRQTGSRDVVVAVIDSGVDYRHQDLSANIWNNVGETGVDAQGRDKKTNRVDDDRNGFVDDWVGWDFTANDNNPMDGDGHGTHVAGTIAAVTDNRLGVAGVSWAAKIMPVQFLNASGSGTTANAIKAVRYAARNNAYLSNNSWGGAPFHQGLLDAINAAARLFVAAAGNDGRNTDVRPHYPSSYASALIVSVAATDHKDSLAQFSNYGLRSVDVAAPGVSIYSTYRNNAYAGMSGTSMAAPVVSGIAALLRSQYPGATHAQIKARILDRADRRPSLNGKMVTGARVNADASLRAP